MARPVTLVTGQWSDLTLDELAEKAAGWGYDGLELSCRQLEPDRLPRPAFGRVGRLRNGSRARGKGSTRVCAES